MEEAAREGVVSGTRSCVDGPRRIGTTELIDALQTLLDVSSRSNIETAAEIELSRDEDSVTSLANLASKDGLVTFAGVNSSQEARKNEHLRSFEIRYLSKRRAVQELSPAPETSSEKRSQGQISFLSKASLFTQSSAAGARSETYQRLLRLSPARKRESGNKRIGAIATGLAPAKESEIVVFNATTSSPTPADVIQRVQPRDGAEAADIDIIEPSEGAFAIAYCTDYDVYLSKLSYDFSARKPQEQPEGPSKAYSMPHPDAFQKPARPKFRALRFLTPSHMLLLENLPNRTGAQLSILRLFSKGGPGEIILRKKLPRHVKAAVGLDTCALDADAETGARQIVVAVAGQDVSITVFTIDYRGFSKDSLSGLRTFTVLRDVHPLQMTKLVFAPFHSPWPAPSSTTTAPPTPSPGTSKASSAAAAPPPKPPGPQYLRLASTSMGNTVAIDTFSLNPLAPTKRGSRYILASARSDALHTGAGLLVAAAVLLVSLLLLQSAVSGGAVALPAGVGAALRRLQPPGARVHGGAAPARERVTGGAGVEVAMPDAPPAPAAAGPQRLRDLLHHVRRTPEARRRAVVVRDAGPAAAAGLLATEVHADDEALLREHAGARRWEELSPGEREAWKERLVRAGQWAVGEGEAVLKGVFFGQVAGAVGGLVGEALRG